MTDMDKAINEAISDLPAGFKMTELGPLPEEWEVVRLGEVASIDETKGNLPTQSDIPFIPMSFIPNDGLYITNWELRKPEEIRSGVIVRNGNLLLAKITPCLENGKQGIVKDLPGNWGYATTEVFPICPSESIVLEFLAFYLKESKVRELLASKMEGATGRQRLPKSVLMGLVVPLPPLPEQRAIAHVLRTVQRAKETTERVIQATRELKKSLMRHLFTYGPVPVGEVEKVPLKETEIGLMPEHWEVVKLEEVVQKTSQIDPQRTPEWSFRYIDVSSVSNDSLSIQSFKEYLGKDAPSRARKQIASGDVIFATVRPYLKRIAIVPPELHDQICSTAFCVIRAKPKIVDNYYIFLVVSDDRFVQRVSERQRGSSYPAVTDSDVLTELIPLPPPSEQREIVGILMAVDKKLQTEEARKQALETLFKTLLPNLMTGKVRVKSSET